MSGRKIDAAEARDWMDKALASHHQDFETFFLARFLGLSYEYLPADAPDAEKDCCRVSFDMHEMFTNPQGTLHGGYVAVAESDPARLELVIAGSGSETALAVEAAAALNAEGRSVRAVSLPSLEVFASQSEAYRESVLPASVPRLVVEAGVELGVARLLRPGDRFHGMHGFGASAPYGVIAEHFGFTAAWRGSRARPRHPARRCRRGTPRPAGPRGRRRPPARGRPRWR